MSIYCVNPVQDARWAKLVDIHPKSSVFHTASWLRTLQQTYGYEPVAFTTSPPTSDLKNGFVFCRVRSWLTGHRLVSLPFSDHCEPLCDSLEELSFLVRYLQSTLDHQEWKYLEVRPIDGRFGLASKTNNFVPTAAYFLHILDLRPDINELFRLLDKDCVQRRIHRADRAGLVEKRGSTEDLLRDFYRLFVITRDRHHLPPTPYRWFQDLARYNHDALNVHVAYKDHAAISAILTLKFRETVYYKYGCSDERFNRFGATSWLLWRAIAAAKANGATQFDMGRTEEGNAGLVAFKNHWVPQPRRLVYWKYPDSSSLDSLDGWKIKIARRIFSIAPKGLLTFAGRVLYRHVG